MKTVLVTGASGFIGNHLVPVLLEHGYTVWGTFLHEHEPRHPHAVWRRWDVNDGAALADILAEAKPTSMVHLASPSHVPSSNKNPEGTIDEILRASVRISKIIEMTPGLDRVLYVSSAEVYGRQGDQTERVSEQAPTRPQSMYGICKLAAAQWFENTLRERVVVLRPFNQIGPGQSPRFAVSSFAHQIATIKHANKEPILTTGNLDVVRDWTDVRESVLGHIAALERGVAGETYNLCSGNGVALRVLVDAMAKAAGLDLALNVDLSRLRPGEVLRFVGNGEKLERAAGWRAERDPRDAAVAAYSGALFALSEKKS